MGNDEQEPVLGNDAIPRLAAALGMSPGPEGAPLEEMRLEFQTGEDASLQIRRSGKWSRQPLSAFGILGIRDALGLPAFGQGFVIHLAVGNFATATYRFLATESMTEQLVAFVETLQPAAEAGPQDKDRQGVHEQV